ncbi:MAG: hypothetical protein IPM52_10035 [Bacteroidetes bacterium]|nr:hypothetical protein [Bacteroidota bacterium]
MISTSPYNELITKLESFIRLYLRNKLLRGFALSVGLIVSYLLLVNLIEYFAYFPGNVRLVLLAGFILLLILTLVFQVVLPAYRLFFFRKFLSHTEAARIIGERLPEVSDKLINLLQLGEQMQITDKENTLLSEAIRQKSLTLHPVQFVKAIDLQTTKKIAKWTALPVGITLLVLLLYPSSIVSPSSRILNYQTEFERPLPYRVKITNQNLEAVHNEDFELKIEVSGEQIPEQFFLLSDGMKIEMNRISTVEFSHIFRKVTRDINFRIIGGNYRSAELTLLVRSRPRLVGYTVDLNFPAYLRRENVSEQNASNLSVPAGTKLRWKFNTWNTDALFVKNDSLELVPERSGNGWILEMLAENTSNIELFGTNNYLQREPLLTVRLDVIRDEYPTIAANDLQEEALSRKRFFNGFITDDYGFTELSAIITLKLSDDLDKTDQKLTRLFLLPSQLRQNFFFTLDFDTLGLQPGQQLNVQFRVSDNDMFKGPKSALTNVFTYQVPSVEMLDSIRKKQERDIEQQLQEMQKNAAAMRKEVQNVYRRLLSKSEPDQNDRALINQLAKQQLSLQQQMEQLKQQRKSLDRFNKENDLLNERLLEKQAMIDRLIEEVIPEDLRKMMEELEKMLEKINKEQLSDLLKKMEMNSDQMEKMLDRNLTMLKQLQFEKEMNALIERLDKLSEELKQNAEKTAAAQKNQMDDLKNKLEDIENKFNRERQTLDSLRKENSGLEQPFRLDDTSGDENQISQDIEKAGQMMEQNKKGESSARQQKASEQMKKLKDQLMTMMQQSEEEQMAEDSQLIRYLLENVLRISFSQEELLNQLSRMKRDDPAYSAVSRRQAMLSESFRVVEDSLAALARRQPMVGNFVLDEVSLIKARMTEAQDKMKDRLTGEATSAQQFAMMSLNNLALMLAESLKNIEESMGNPSSGKGKGKSKRPMPGNSMQRMRELQEALGKQLQEMMQGKQTGQGNRGMSEEIARMAAQQEALRQQLRSLMDQLKSEGVAGDQGLNKILDDMEKLEERLVNKYLDEQTMRLQRNIEVRMLESEKALKEREQEERRESFEFKGENIGNQIDLSEYNNLIKMQQDMLRTSPLNLQPFLKDRARNYFIRFNETRNNETYAKP